MTSEALLVAFGLLAVWFGALHYVSRWRTARRIRQSRYRKVLQIREGAR